MRLLFPRRQPTPWLGLAVLAWLAASALGCGKNDELTGIPPDGGGPDGGGGAGAQHELTLLITGKVGGSLEPCG